MPEPRFVPPFALFLFLSVVWLAGCGGDDPAAPTPEPEPTETVDGTLGLPAGWPGDPAELEVLNSHATVACDGDGGFSLECFRDDRQLVVARGADGPLLMAWFGDDATRIDTRTTAEVLLWHALGAWMLPAGSRTGMREAIADLDAELDGLVAALDEVVAANPGGLADESSALHAALQAVVDALLAEEDDKSLIIAPDVMRSGMQVLNQGGINKTTLRNSYRRRGVAFIWKDAWTDVDDVRTPLNPDSAIIKLEVPPVDGFGGVLSTIVGYLVTGGIAYTPVERGPYELPVHPDAKITHYRVNLLGFGLHPAADPSAYTSAEWEAGEWVSLKCVAMDYFLPMVMNMAGAVGDDMPLDGLLGGSTTSAVNTYVQFVALNVPDCVQALRDRDLWNAVLALMSSALTNGELQNRTVSLLTQSLVASSLDADQVVNILDSVKGFLQITAYLDIVGVLFDNIAMGVQFEECRQADSWTVDVTAPVINIIPHTSEIEVHNSQRLDCGLDDDTGGPPTGAAYAFRWFCAGEAGYLINPADPSARSTEFLSSYDYCYYQADLGVAGVEEVSCAVYYSVGGDTTFIAADTVPVTVTRREVVLPDSLGFCGEAELTLEPTIVPPYTGDEVVVWAWRSAGAPGTLDGPSGQTGSWDLESDGTATFTSFDAGGTGELLCIASRDIDGTISPVDTAVVYVDVGAQETYGGEIWGEHTFDPETQMCSWGVYVRFPKVGGANGYTVHMYDYVDHTGYYGTSHTFHGPSWPAYSYETGSEIFLFLTGGGGNCSGPSPDSLAWGLSRFTGAVVEVTPDCD